MPIAILVPYSHGPLKETANDIFYTAATQPESLYAAQNTWPQVEVITGKVARRRHAWIVSIESHTEEHDVDD
jgi:hypothetical protein